VAGVHAGGFVVAGLGGLVAVGTSRGHADHLLAGALALVAALGGTPGWYAYLLGFFAWVTLLAARTAREAADSPSVVAAAAV
jgi:hypothetical protein